MNTTSTIYTMGTALNRAHADHVPVALLVEGHWLRGHVLAVDGHGVILNNNSEHSVVRMDAVAAVRVTTTDNTHDTLGSPPEQTPLNRRPSTTFSTPTPTSRTNSPSPAGSPRLELPPNVTAGRIGVSGRLSITRDAVRDWVKRDQIDAETSLAGQR